MVETLLMNRYTILEWSIIPKMVEMDIKNLVFLNCVDLFFQNSILKYFHTVILILYFHTVIFGKVMVDMVDMFLIINNNHNSNTNNSI